MTMILALVGALALASVPIRLGWNRGWNESQIAQAFGLSEKRRLLDMERIEAWAAQTGTGLTAQQIAFGTMIWTAGGLIVGMLLGGLLQMFLFAVSGSLMYLGSLQSQRDDYRMKQAKDLLHAVGIMKGVLREGRGLEDAVYQAAQVDGAGGVLFSNLYQELRNSDNPSDAFITWSRKWQNPSVDLLAGVLSAALRNRVELVGVIEEIRQVIREQVRILAHGRAEAKGIEWQAKFLALWPPLVLLAMRFTGGNMWSNPIHLMPLLLGAGLSYYLTMRMVRARLSLDASLGLLPAGQGEIPTDRFGAPL